MPLIDKLRTVLDDLLDVTITSPADNELLAYDTSSGEWINQTPTEAGLDAIFLKLDASNDPITGDLLLTPTADSTSVFQVQQSDNTVVLNVDTTNARVGIGTATPGYLFTIANDTVPRLDLTKLDGTLLCTWNSDVANSKINFSARNNYSFNIASENTGTPQSRFTLNNGEGFAVFARANSNSVTAAARVHIQGGANQLQFLVRAHSTQTANILEIQKSDGTVLSWIEGRGTFACDLGTPNKNFFIGPGAGRVGATGDQNTAIGSIALDALTSGGNNFACGQQSLTTLTSGSFNTALGSSSGRIINTTSENTMIGYASGDNATGSENVLVGSLTMAGASTTGTKNTIIGTRSGYLKSGGNNNIFIGFKSGYRQTNLSDQLIIDNQIRATAATELTNSILYGVMAAAPANQTLKVNASLFVSQLLITSGATAQTNASNLQIEGDWAFAETTAPTADDGYGKIWTDTDNELWFQSGDGNNHLLHGDAFSNIWYHGSTTGAMTVEVTISTQNALALIDSFTVVGHEDDLLNIVGSASTNNLTLSAIAGGEYEISFHGSVTATGGADKEMLICLGITLATLKDITDVTDNLVSPIVITSTAHGLEDGDMVQILGVLGNTAANGSFIVSSKADDTFEIIDLSGGATTGNGDFNQGSPTGDITIWYPGNMMVHRMVRGADLGAISATGLHILANSDKLALYVANLSGDTNLTVSTVSLSADRVGD